MLGYGPVPHFSRIIAISAVRISYCHAGDKAYPRSRKPGTNSLLAVENSFRVLITKAERKKIAMYKIVQSSYWKVTCSNC